MIQHTPGPWKKMGRDIVAPSPRYAKSHLLVAQVYETAMMVEEQDHAESDAVLIAAAPDLLEALKRIASIEANRHMIATWKDLASESIDIARAAIAKAEAQS